MHVFLYSQKIVDGRSARYMPDVKNLTSFETARHIYEKQYKIPKISNKTDKGKWLNAYANTFLKGGWIFDGQFKKLKIKLKTTQFKINNSAPVVVQFFKNLKKLKADNFVGEVFNVQTNLKEAA